MPVNNNKTTLIILAIIGTAILPLLLAWLAYSGNFLQSSHKINNGVLISSPPNFSSWNFLDSSGLSFAQSILQHKWTVMYLAPEQCQETCKKNIYNLGQLKKALGKQRDRMEPVVLAKNKLLYKNIARDFPSIHFIFGSNKVKIPLQNTSEQQFYIIDPNGNIILYYGSSSNISLLLKDLKKLMRVSQIG